MQKMGKKKKKMKFLPFLSKRFSSSSWPWPWPSCPQQPRTLSFRKANDVESPDDSLFEIQFQSPRESFSTSGDDSTESVVRGLISSDRLFYEPRETSSILREAKEASSQNTTTTTMFLSMESMDPLMDFKKSMEEMVEARGYQKDWDWEGLEELLCCYLRVNAKSNHGYVFAAFVQVVGELAGAGGGGAIKNNDSSAASSSVYCSCSQSPSSSPSSNFYTSSSSSLEADDEEIHLHQNGRCSSALVEINEIIQDYCCYA